MTEGKKIQYNDQSTDKTFKDEWIHIHKNELKKLNEFENISSVLKETLNRLKVEFIEYQERAKREKETTKKFALEGFLRDLFPLLDTLDNTIAVFDDPKIQEGILMVKKEIIKVLENHGVREIKTTGEKFDPKLHEAIELVSDPKAEADSIVAELKKGYTYNDRVLRPAIVKVCKKN
ncbi:MAG: nucleotide exchange factor GrpE [Planctomycetes bacterium]|nr:nucleotide exchange factor GrpE [Planctomycetota bacterium]